jgi:predicted RNA binding protein with dsRBD fold (UPF0201 family)
VVNQLREGMLNREVWRNIIKQVSFAAQKNKHQTNTNSNISAITTTTTTKAKNRSQITKDRNTGN